ncbi:M23 family metallopeptidase [Pedobacter duraquae]|nr:M23 family metallopeptidase [Pedobacter duraquae]
MMTSLLRKIVMSVTACFTFVNAFTQEPAVMVNYKVNTNKSVTFDYVKTDPGNYTVAFKLTNLSNAYASDNTNLNAGFYSGRLLNLEPTNKDQGIGFSYSYSYIRGKLKPKFNPDFVYTLPCKNGTKVKVLEVSFLNAMYFGNTTPEDWKVYRFCTAKEDTVTAMRKGIVVEIKDTQETNLGEGVEYSSRINELTIEHADGTIATYKHFKRGSFTVKVGETVYPGTPLGINVKYNANSMYGATVMIMYLKSADFEAAKNQNVQNSKSMYGFVTPHFYTAEGADLILIPQKDYTAASTPELVKKEMSKKEQKLAAL